MMNCRVCNLDLNQHTLEDLQKCELREKLTKPLTRGGDQLETAFLATLGS